MLFLAAGMEIVQLFCGESKKYLISYFVGLTIFDTTRAS